MARRIPAILFGVFALMLAACAATPATRQAQGERQVHLRNGSALKGLARYDMEAKACRNGLSARVEAAQFEELRAGWTKPPGATCSGPEKRTTPATAGYPEAFARLQRAGSAHVLVRIEADGRVESARAMCATDDAFAHAAEATALAITYSPRVCDGASIRSAFLLPFDYSFE